MTTFVFFNSCKIYMILHVNLNWDKYFPKWLYYILISIFLSLILSLSLPSAFFSLFHSPPTLSLSSSSSSFSLRPSLGLLFTMQTISHNCFHADVLVQYTCVISIVHRLLIKFYRSHAGDILMTQASLSTLINTLIVLQFRTKDKNMRCLIL